MKQALAVLWQTVVLFLAAFAGFAIGLFVPAIRMTHLVSRTATNVRTFDYDCLVAAVLMFLVLLGIGALRKRVRETAITAGISLVIALAVLLLFTQIGIKDTPIYS